ncbi:MAG: NAD-dependent epimerase/dehydratase family protein [Planctomycetota bacterium]
MAKYLVTGANGFAGSHLVEELLRRGHNVACLVRKTSDLRYIENLDVEFVYGELRDPASLESAVAGRDIVIHNAAVTRAFYPREHFEINTGGTVAMLKACAGTGNEIGKFVYVSSQAAAGPSPDETPIDEDCDPHPVSAYGRSKLLAEKYVLSYSNRFPVTIVRPSAVYGPRDRDCFGNFRDAARHVSTIVGFGRSLLSITHIYDIVQGIILAAESGESTGRVYFICYDRAYSWQEITRAIAKAVGKRTVNLRFAGETVKMLSRALTGAARIGRALGVCKKPPLLTVERGIELSMPFWVCDCGRAKKELGFEPRIDNEKGAALTAEWYRKEGWL